MDSHEAQLEANVARIQHYVDNLFAVKHRTAHQDAALAHDLDTLARNQRALKAYQENPDLPEVTAIDIGPDPLPNHAQPNTETYGCPEGFSEADYMARHGFSVQHGTDLSFTALLRPDLSRWQKLVGPTFSQANANYFKHGDISKQRQAIDYAAGKIPFSAIAGLFGGGYPELGCNVDISKIHDLGA